MNRDHLESEHIAKYADEREPCPIRECPLRERMQTAERKSDMMGVYRWIVGVLLGLLFSMLGRNTSSVWVNKTSFLLMKNAVELKVTIRISANNDGKMRILPLNLRSFNIISTFLVLYILLDASLKSD